MIDLFSLLAVFIVMQAFFIIDLFSLLTSVMLSLSCRHRTVSELERHSTQTGPPNMDAIAENEDQPSDGRDSKAQKKMGASSKASETGVKQEKPDKSDKQEVSGYFKC